jgi:hypothetical protein
MGEKGAHARLVHSAHIIKLLFLALERSPEELLHLDRRRRLRADAQPDPIPQVKDDHKGEQQLQNLCPKPLHLDSHPTPSSACQADRRCLVVFACECVAQVPGKETAGPSTTPRSVEKHFQGGAAEPQISPLRCASVEMTKGRAVPPSTVVAEQEPFFITLGGPKAHDSSVEKHFQERTAEPQISPLGSPGFPVETRGFDDLHAALFTESRTRGRR